MVCYCKTPGFLKNVYIKNQSIFSLVMHSVVSYYWVINFLPLCSKIDKNWDIDWLFCPHILIKPGFLSWQILIIMHWHEEISWLIDLKSLLRNLFTLLLCLSLRHVQSFYPFHQVLQFFDLLPLSNITNIRKTLHRLVVS